MNRQAPTQHRMRLRLSAYGCFGALLIGLGSSHAADLPGEFSATYDVKKSGITIGETQRTLHREGDAYVFESITRPVGIAKLFTSGQVVERSHWDYFQGQPRPLQYTLFNSGGKEDRSVQLDFDWEKNQVINTVDDQPWTMPLEHDTSDKLLYQLRIMQDLPTTASTLRYPVADGGKLKYYDIEILGQERIKTALGNFDTVRLRYIKGSRKTTLWCASELAYLPVRIEQRKDDDSPVIAVLTSVRGL